MKYITSLILILLMLFSTTHQASAQTKQKLNAAPMYYINTLDPADSVTFAASTSDTCPRSTSVWATNSSTFKIGGASRVDLELIVKDSIKMDVYVERRLPAHNGTAAGSWTAILTDSLINITGSGANSGKRQVYQIRSPETDLADQLSYEYRVITAPRTAGATIGTSTPYIYRRILWYP